MVPMRRSSRYRFAKKLAETKVLIEELEDFQVSFSDTGAARFGARVGRHDDIVMSVAVAMWWVFQEQRSETRVRPFLLLDDAS